MLISSQPTCRLEGLSSDWDVPDFAGLDSLATVLLQVHVADLPHTPGLGHPHVLVAVALARHHLVYLTEDTAAESRQKWFCCSGTMWSHHFTLD